MIYLRRIGLLPDLHICYCRLLLCRWRSDVRPDALASVYPQRDVVLHVAIQSLVNVGPIQAHALEFE